MAGLIIIPISETAKNVEFDGPYLSKELNDAAGGFAARGGRLSGFEISGHDPSAIPSPTITVQPGTFITPTGVVVEITTPQTLEYSLGGEPWVLYATTADEKAVTDVILAVTGVSGGISSAFVILARRAGGEDVWWSEPAISLEGLQAESTGGVFARRRALADSPGFTNVSFEGLPPHAEEQRPYKDTELLFADGLKLYRDQVGSSALSYSGWSHEDVTLGAAIGASDIAELVLSDDVLTQEVQTAVAGNPTFTLTNPYVPDSNDLLVFNNGKLVTQEDYTEASTTTVIWIGSALVGGEIFEFVVMKSVLARQEIVHGGAGPGADVSLDFEYVPRSHSLLVFSGGLKFLVHDDFVEVDTHHITMVAAISGSERLIFVHLRSSIPHDKDGIDSLKFETPLTVDGVEGAPGSPIEVHEGSPVIDIATATPTKEGVVETGDAAPPAIAAAGAAGTANGEVANEDHTHAHGTGHAGGAAHAVASPTVPGFVVTGDAVPPAIAAAGDVGTANGAVSNEDHTHAHGSQAGGSTHDTATPTVQGFVEIGEAAPPEIKPTGTSDATLIGTQDGEVANENHTHVHGTGHTDVSAHAIASGGGGKGFAELSALLPSDGIDSAPPNGGTLDGKVSNRDHAHFHGYLKSSTASGAPAAASPLLHANVLAETGPGVGDGHSGFMTQSQAEKLARNWMLLEAFFVDTSVLVDNVPVPGSISIPADSARKNLLIIFSLDLLFGAGVNADLEIEVPLLINGTAANTLASPGAPSISGFNWQESRFGVITLNTGGNLWTPSESAAAAFARPRITRFVLLNGTNFLGIASAITITFGNQFVTPTGHTTKSCNRQLIVYST